MGIIATSSPTIHQATTSLENPIITPATGEPGSELDSKGTSQTAASVCEASDTYILSSVVTML